MFYKYSLLHLGREFWARLGNRVGCFQAQTELSVDVLLNYSCCDSCSNRQAILELGQSDIMLAGFTDMAEADFRSQVHPDAHLAEPETTNVNTMLSRFMSQPSQPHQPSQPSQQKKPGRFACDLCEKDYSRSSDLKRHKNQKHGNISLNVNNSQPHSTISQPQSTTSQPESTISQPPATIVKRKKAKCKDPVCGKTFNQNSYMLRHFNKFHFIDS